MVRKTVRSCSPTSRARRRSARSGFALVRRIPHSPREPPPFLARLAERPRVLLPLEPLELALQLAPALEPLDVERACSERGAHCAARLARVRAVGEPALGGERLDVRERGLETLVSAP